MPAKSVLFVDSRVSNYQSFIDGLTEPAEVFVLNGASDGLGQMASHLYGRTGIDAIHVISHGSVGTLYLGSTALNGGNLGSYQSQLASIGSALTETGDILLYGCNVAQGDAGVQFIGNLAQATGADVAASKDATGAEALGGAWVLEEATGRVEATRLDAEEKIGLLAVNLAPSFAASDGKLTTAISSGNDSGMSLVLQIDGKILVAGYSDSRGNNLNNDFALVRYNTNGSLDASFSDDGKVTTDLNDGNDFGSSVALQADGKILVVGHTDGLNGHDIAIVRYNTDGSLDTSFSGDGKLTTAIGSSHDDGSSITIQSDGKILVAGSSYNGNSYEFALVRYNTDGSLDRSFSDDGKVTTAIGASDAVGKSVVVQTNGKILIAGLDGSFNGNIHHFALARYNTDGSLDISFSDDGKVTTAIGSRYDSGNSVTLQADGKILVAGYSTNDSSSDFALVRYNTDGSLDTSFSDDGKVTTAIGSRYDSGNSVTLQADGKILMAGFSLNDSTRTFAVARYNTDGSLDGTFSPAENTLDTSPIYAENGLPISLNAHVQVLDAELSSSGNYSGAILTLSRHGGESTQDIFSSTGANLTTLTANSYFAVDGVTIGRVTANDAGTLTLAFNANANQALVNKAMQQIAYSNASDSPPASVQIDWTFNDGNVGAQGTGGAMSVTGSTTVTITPVNDPPVLVTPIANQTVKTTTAFNFSVPVGTFNDPDLETLAYNVAMVDGTGIPPWLHFNAATQTFTATPSTLDIGAFNLTITAKDVANTTASSTFRLTVVDSPPTINGVPSSPVAVTAGTAAALADFTVADPDGAGVILSLTLTANNGNVNGLTDANLATPGIQLVGTAASINGAVASATFTSASAGGATIGISVTDGLVAPVMENYYFSATAASAAPTIGHALGAVAFAPKLDFAARGTIPTSDIGPRSIVSADVNSDGKMDLIIAIGTAGSVSVLLGKGDGTFVPGILYGTGSAPFSVASADVNSDGKADLIAANFDSNTVSVLLGEGDGTFGTKVDYSTGASSNPYSVTTADVNGDSRVDLISANSSSNTVSVLLGKGDGTFEAKVDYATGNNPVSVTNADVDADGKVDLVVAHSGSDSVLILMGHGDGTFVSDVHYPTDNIPFSVTSADVNSDGKMDLIATNIGSRTVSVFMNNGDGTFAPKLSYATGAYPISVTSADVNADGRIDIIVANNQSFSVSLLTNVSAVVNTTAYTQQGPLNLASGLLVSDVNGDSDWNGGKLKVQITSHSEAADTIYLPNANHGGNGIWLDNAGNKVMAGNTQIGSADAASVANGTAWTLSFNANATNALVQSVAQSLMFNNTSNAPNTDSRVVTFTATDKGVLSSTGTQTVSFGGALIGATGNDTLTGNPGNDRINGLSGLDTSNYSQNLSAYTTSPSAVSGPDGSDTLTSIERLQFLDANLAFDIDANAGQVYRLYQAAFNRTPDLGGLGGWIAAMDDGMPLLTIASKFMESAEFQSLYGANPTNAQFVANLYTNALHRPSQQDAGSAAGWVNQLASNTLTKAQALVNFSESAENKTSVLPVISGGITYATAAQAAGPAKGQSFAGTPNADSLIGTVGNDTFTGGAGNDTIEGGKGLDTAVYSGAKASHTIARTATGLTVAEVSNGIDTLTNVERLKFDDAILAMDTAGNAGQTYRLYQAAFNRTPDKAGLSDWVKGMDTGLTLTQMATAFIGSGEFKDKYGANPTNAQFVDLLYANALHRARAVGDDYWTHQLDSGVTREQALIGFSESAENQASLIGVIQNGIELVLG